MASRAEPELTRDRRRERPRQRVSGRALALAGGHLAALSAFAVAQPLFDLLSKNAEFFVVRGSTPGEVVVFALGVTLLPPAALLAGEGIVGLPHRDLMKGLHLVFVAVLAGTVAIQALKRYADVDSTNLLIGGSAVLGLAFAAAYARVGAVRSALSVLIPAPLLFLALFLFSSPVSKLVVGSEGDTSLANVTSQAPVVLVVLDEFPVNSLLDERGRIDAERYPNFAGLAGESTWFRNTTSVSTQTVKAVPAILTGKYPRKDQLPIPADHPQNLFTLLGASYRLNIVESQTRLCPPSLCRTIQRRAQVRHARSLRSDIATIYLHLVAPPELEERLAPLSNQWADFGADQARIDEFVRKAALTNAPKKKQQGRFYEGRVKSFERFIRSLRPGGRPSLNFLHVLLPHGPWQYLPSGRQFAVIEPGAPGRIGDRWAEPWLAVQAQQRHLLQTAFVDRLIGRLVARLRELELYEKSVLVVTADHGVSFRAGDTRRRVTPTNVHDIAFVPFFLKRPGQRRGSVVEHHVRTVDILPAMAEALGIRIPWRIDGRSAFQPRPPGGVTVSGQAEDYAVLARRRDEALRLQIRLFGAGDEPPGVFGAGPHRELLGHRVNDLQVVGLAASNAQIADLTAGLLRSLPKEPVFVPTPVQGTISGEETGAGRALAVAVNGRVEAVCRTFWDKEVRFAALVPESAFRAGFNRVDLYWVEKGPAGLELRALSVA